MGARKFDLRLGRDRFAEVPAAPGVYRFFDPAGAIVYIGKAKNLRRRLAQYRNAQRLKAHAKMRAIVAVSARLDWTVTSDDLEACRLELAAIQAERPRLNVAGAYCHIYPLVFLAPGSGWLGLTTQEDVFRPAWSTRTGEATARVHGTFRSRRRARDFFASLLFLLERVGHVHREQPTRALRFSKIAHVRQTPLPLLGALDAWLSGADSEFLPALLIALTESAYARAHPREIQEHLAELARFHREEILPLARARRETGYVDYPVPRAHRDRLFLDARALQGDDGRSRR